MTYDELTQMNLHERNKVDVSTTVMKVYGGWIYTHYRFDNGHYRLAASTFVPEALNVFTKGG